MATEMRAQNLKKRTCRHFMFTNWALSVCHESPCSLDLFTDFLKFVLSGVCRFQIKEFSPPLSLCKFSKLVMDFLPNKIAVCGSNGIFRSREIVIMATISSGLFLLAMIDINS